MHGLMRVRGFTQDDAHVFCTEAGFAEQMPQDQRADPVDLCRFRLLDGELTVKLSTQPENASARRDVDHAERGDGDGAREIQASRSRDPASDRDHHPGEGAFYGPSSICTARRHRPRLAIRHHAIDFNLPERFGASTSMPTARRRRRYVVHRAICGSIKRFIGILIEHFAGNFPLSLAPLQAVVTTIASEGGSTPRWFARRAACRPARRDRFAQREDQHRSTSIRWRRSRPARRRRRSRTHSVSIRRLGGDGQKVMPTDEADRRTGGGSDAAI